MYIILVLDLTILLYCRGCTSVKQQYRPIHHSNKCVEVSRCFTRDDSCVYHSHHSNKCVEVSRYFTRDDSCVYHSGLSLVSGRVAISSPIPTKQQIAKSRNVPAGPNPSNNEG
ncbi:hypothetical protein HUJ05_008092, partial [Dendroctonus ponderosae]